MYASVVYRYTTYYQLYERGRLCAFASVSEFSAVSKRGGFPLSIASRYAICMRAYWLYAARNKFPSPSFDAWEFIGGFPLISSTHKSLRADYNIQLSSLLYNQPFDCGRTTSDQIFFRIYAFFMGMGTFFFLLWSEMAIQSPLPYQSPDHAC